MRTPRNNNTIQQLDQAAVHDWYRFVLSYPDHLVTDVIERFGIKKRQIVLDPFVGTGTTLIECKKQGISSIGIDANPVMAFASRVKTNWDIDLIEFDKRRSSLLESLRASLDSVGSTYPIQYSFHDLLPASHTLRERGIDESTVTALLPKGWISDLPLRKVIKILKAIDALPDDSITDLFRLALASVVVSDASNLGFGPEVYVAKTREDADVHGAFSRKLERIVEDLAQVQQITDVGTTKVCFGDARRLTELVNEPIDFVITSPPYPNEKDYTRTTRLELILMGFMRDKADLRHVKQSMLRSHTRNIFVADDDSQYVADIPEIQLVAQEIEKKRIERGATSGFEKLYHRVTREYFGGMYLLLDQLQKIMPIGGKVALVVGDQMSYFRVPIRTSKLLSIVACRKLGYKENEMILWRTRRATVTRMDVEEHILILERT